MWQKILGVRELDSESKVHIVWDGQKPLWQNDILTNKLSQGVSHVV